MKHKTHKDSYQAKLETLRRKKVRAAREELRALDDKKILSYQAVKRG